MAIDSRAVSVATTATRLDTAAEADSVAGSAVAIHNNGSAVIYIGASGVTTTNGFPLSAGASMTFRLDSQADALYGIVASGTAEARVLELGV